jgi:hypothetical protein
MYTFALQSNPRYDGGRTHPFHPTLRPLFLFLDATSAFCSDELFNLHNRGNTRAETRQVLPLPLQVWYHWS